MWIAQAHCSPTCAAKTRSDRARAAWPRLTCPMCDVEFRVRPGEVDKRVTCGASECMTRYVVEVKAPKISARVKAEHEAGVRHGLGGISPREIRLAEYLHPLGWVRNLRFIHGGDAFELDFALLPAMLNVELDGPEHRYAKRRARDAERDGKLRALGWQVLRLPNDAVDDDAEAVARGVADWMRQASPIPDA